VNRELSSITSRIAEITERIKDAALSAGRKPEEIKIIGVSKGHSSRAVLEAVEAGVRDFGENYLQELAEKFQEISARALNIHWHFQGHIQRRKIKEILKYTNSILSVSRIEEFEEIERRASETINCYIEVNLGSEEQKNGVDPDELGSMLDNISKFKMIKVEGLMTVPPVSDNPRRWFSELRTLGEKFGLTKLSMGMTSDFEDAIREGSTMVRIGTAIFGERKQYVNT